MPFIHTKVNRPIAPEQEKRLAKELGKAIGLLGKSEQWLMLEFSENCRLYFRGDDQRPLAFVSVKLLGRAERGAYEQLTGKITQLLQDILGIDPDEIYVQYDETESWGWQGGLF